MENSYSDVSSDSWDGELYGNCDAEADVSSDSVDQDGEVIINAKLQHQAGTSASNDAHQGQRHQMWQHDVGAPGAGNSAHLAGENKDNVLKITTAGPSTNTAAAQQISTTGSALGQFSKSNATAQAGLKDKIALPGTFSFTHADKVTATATKPTGDAAKATVSTHGKTTIIAGMKPSGASTPKPPRTVASKPSTETPQKPSFGTPQKSCTGPPKAGNSYGHRVFGTGKPTMDKEKNKPKHVAATSTKFSESAAAYLKTGTSSVGPRNANASGVQKTTGASLAVGPKRPQGLGTIRATKAPSLKTLASKSLVVGAIKSSSPPALKKSMETKGHKTTKHPTDLAKQGMTLGANKASSKGTGGKPTDKMPDTFKKLPGTPIPKIKPTNSPTLRARSISLTKQYTATASQISSTKTAVNPMSMTVKAAGATMKGNKTAVGGSVPSSRSVLTAPAGGKGATSTDSARANKAAPNSSADIKKPAPSSSGGVNKATTKTTGTNKHASGGPAASKEGKLVGLGTIRAGSKTDSGASSSGMKASANGSKAAGENKALHSASKTTTGKMASTSNTANKANKPTPDASKSLNKTTPKASAGGKTTGPSTSGAVVSKTASVASAGGYKDGSGASANGKHDYGTFAGVNKTAGVSYGKHDSATSAGVNKTAGVSYGKHDSATSAGVNKTAGVSYGKHDSATSAGSTKAAGASSISAGSGVSANGKPNSGNSAGANKAASVSDGVIKPATSTGGGNARPGASSAKFATTTGEPRFTSAPTHGTATSTASEDKKTSASDVPAVEKKATSAGGSKPISSSVMRENWNEHENSH